MMKVYDIMDIKHQRFRSTSAMRSTLSVSSSIDDNILSLEPGGSCGTLIFTSFDSSEISFHLFE